MNNMRKNGYVGVLETESLSGENVSVHFSEWWNGEGLDFTIEYGNRKTGVITLSLDEMRLMVTAMVATGMVDLEEIQNAVDRLVAESKASSDLINRITPETIQQAEEMIHQPIKGRYR